MMSTPADEYATDLTDAQWRLICIRGNDHEGGRKPLTRTTA